MKKNKKLIILSILGVLIVLCLVLTITKAFMKPITDIGNLTEVSLNSCAKIQLTSESSIDLENTYPMSRNRGLQTTPYTFTVTSYCDDYVGFTLYFSSVDSNTLEDSSIYYILTYKDSDEVLVEGNLGEAKGALEEFSDSDIIELETGLGTTHKNIYRLYVDSLPYQGSNEYNLYLFVDGDVVDSTSENETFVGGVSVRSFDATGTIKFVSKYDTTILSGTEVAVYKVGDIDRDGGIISVGAFSEMNFGYIESSEKNYWIYKDACNVETDASADSEIEVLAAEAAGIISDDEEFESDFQCTTDETGTCIITGLETGLYLVVPFETATENYNYTSDPFLLVLPSYQCDNNVNKLTYNRTINVIDYQEERLGALDITSTNISDNSGLNVVYNITATSPSGTTYNYVVSNNFSGDGTQTSTVADIPSGSTVTIEPTYVSSDFTIISDSIVETMIVAGDTTEVTFEYEYTGGTSIISNRYGYEDYIIQGDTTEIENNNSLDFNVNFENWTFTTNLSNISSNPVYIRIKTFNSSSISPTYSGDEWTEGTDGWWYYSEIVANKETTSDINIVFNSDDIADLETKMENYFNFEMDVYIIAESTLVLYDSSGNPYADWGS